MSNFACGTIDIILNFSLRASIIGLYVIYKIWGIYFILMVINETRRYCLPAVILAVTGHSIGFNHVTEMATLLYVSSSHTLS